MDQIPVIKARSKVVSLDQLLTKIDGGVFCLVRVAMLRACEIHAGKPAMIDMHGLTSDKSTTIALEEIAQGKIGYKMNKHK